MEDRIGQEIEVGQFVMVMIKPTGWDKVTKLTQNVVTRLTAKMVCIGHPDDKKKTKPENIMVLTEEQIEGWIRKENLEEAAEDLIEHLHEVRNNVLPIN